MAVRGCWLRVAATPEGVVVTGADDNPGPITVRLEGHDLELAPGGSIMR
ncbi:MAG: glycosyl hydrolase family 65 protein [Actinomycetota bacterium]